MDRQVSPCCPNFLTVTQSYHSKVTYVGALHAEKIAEAVLLYVFRIAFLASLLGPTINNETSRSLNMFLRTDWSMLVGKGSLKKNVESMSMLIPP